MKKWLLITAGFIMSLKGAELHEKLQPLKTPSLASAKVVLESMKDEKPDSFEAQIAKAIKSVFTEEFQLQESIKSARAKSIEADQLDANTRKWLQPNAMGTTNKEIAKDKANYTQAARNQMLNDLYKSIEELNQSTIQLDQVIKMLKEKQEITSAKILEDAVKEINERTAKPAAGVYVAMAEDSANKTQSLADELSKLDDNPRKAKMLVDPLDSLFKKAIRNAERSGDIQEALRLMKAKQLINSPVRYLGNKKTKEVHDRVLETPQCQIEAIQEEHREYFAGVLAATAKGYDKCGHCMIGSER